MRLSTIIISSAFVLAGMSAALSVERENMLAARSADSDFLAEFEARAYDEEFELYARGAGLSRPSRGRNRDPYGSDGRRAALPQIRQTSSRDPLVRYRGPPTGSRDSPAYRKIRNNGLLRASLGSYRRN